MGPSVGGKKKTKKNERIKNPYENQKRSSRRFSFIETD